MSYAGRTYVLAVNGMTQQIVDVYEGDTTKRSARVWAGVSGGVSDDHDNGAIIVAASKKPIVFYTQHGAENLMKWRIGNATIDADPLLAQGFGPERTFPTTGGTTYAQAHILDGSIHLLFRDTNNYFTYARSDDWGQTFTTPVRVFHHIGQCDLSSALVGSVLRIATSMHPGNGNESIWYAEIDLTTGAVTKSDGTVLGNLSGTSLPLEVSTSLEVAAVAAGAPDATYKWHYDVSDGPTPEIVWASFATSTIDTSSMYQYTVRTGDTWATKPIVAAGGRFSDPSQTYLGGAQLPRGTVGGRVYLSRKVNGVWRVDRYDTSDNGVTWAATLQGQSIDPLVRAWPVEARDAGVSPFAVAAEVITRFAAFTDMDSRIVALNPNPAFGA